MAQEHAATHVSERVVSAVAAASSALRTPNSPASRHVLFACAEGERHTLPARIAAEVLRLRGFDVHFLGSQALGSTLMAHVHREGPDLVAVSCMMPVRLPAAHRLIEGCRHAGVPVLAGGPGFGPEGAWARTLGADLYAADPAAAAEMLTTRWPDIPGEAAPLEHLADGEYSAIVRRRAELLRELLAVLSERYPVLVGPDLGNAEAALEEFGQLPDVVAAASYVDDPRVLIDYLSFGTEFIEARGVPAVALGTAVAVQSRLLGGLPRTSAHLGTAMRWLADAGHGVSPG